MLEKRFYAVPPQSFTADGTTDGVITIASEACQLFKVKQVVILTANTLPDLALEVKEIDNEGNIQVGPFAGQLNVPGGNTGITARSNISAYTVALSAAIRANEQRRPAIDYAELMRAVYDEEPAVALRNVLVDECGNRFNATNPLPVGNAPIWDEIDLSYDVNQNLQTVVYKKAGTSTTLTLFYDSNQNLIEVLRS